MGIYGALATAVTGLRAQAFALENISGNIANSQTTGFKRLETGFIDLIPDAAVGRQVPGAVLAYSRSTNDVRGDIVTSPTGTHVALNGSGFFVVGEKTGTTDGKSVFGDANYFTRRGDFEMDREGYLVNGAGYYLKGIPVEGGNVAGSVPEMIKIGNGLIDAKATSRINYQLNLPATPAAGTLGGRAAITSSDSGLTLNTPLVDLSGYNAGDDEITIDVNGTARTFTIGGNAPNGGNTVGELIDWINASGSGASASLNSDGQLVIRTRHVSSTLEISGSANVAGLNDIGVVPGDPVNDADFIARTIEGGAITVYSPDGSSNNVLMRWGQVGTDPSSWRLYYQSNSSPETWSQVGDGDFEFSSNGRLTRIDGNDVNPDEPVRLTIEGLSVNGRNVGNVELDFGVGGLTQFANASGVAGVTTLAQDGYPAGSFMSVAINDSGRVVATYSNGEQVELFQLVTANFNAQNMLKRLDGGLYAATAQSGEAIFSTDGGVTGGALETSNTDISEEFTKLITTQQAYAAGTRIVSTSDEMLREALNMVR